MKGKKRKRERNIASERYNIMAKGRKVRQEHVLNENFSLIRLNQS